MRVTHIRFTIAQFAGFTVICALACAAVREFQVGFVIAVGVMAAFALGTPFAWAFQNLRRRRSGFRGGILGGVAGFVLPGIWFTWAARYEPGSLFFIGQLGAMYGILVGSLMEVVNLIAPLADPNAAVDETGLLRRPSEFEAAEQGDLSLAQSPVDPNERRGQE